MEFGDNLGVRDRVRLEIVIVVALAGHNRASLEMHLQDVLKRVWTRNGG
jgi:hypothetical protein